MVYLLGEFNGKDWLLINTGPAEKVAVRYRSVEGGLVEGELVDWLVLDGELWKAGAPLPEWSALSESGEPKIWESAVPGAWDSNEVIVEIDCAAEVMGKLSGGFDLVFDNGYCCTSVRGRGSELIEVGATERWSDGARYRVHCSRVNPGIYGAVFRAGQVKGSEGKISYRGIELVSPAVKRLDAGVPALTKLAHTSYGVIKGRLSDEDVDHFKAVLAKLPS